MCLHVVGAQACPFMDPLGANDPGSCQRVRPYNGEEVQLTKNINCSGLGVFYSVFDAVSMLNKEGS